MKIEIKERFSTVSALSNAIQTLKLFLDNYCGDINISCTECRFRYGVDEEGNYLCPNCELSLPYDIEVLESLLKMIDYPQEVEK